MKLALVHLDSRPFDFEHNITEIERSYVASLCNKPDIVLYPELAISGYFMITDKTLLTEENIRYNEECLQKLVNTVKLSGVPICIGAVKNNQSVYILIDDVGVNVIHTRNAHNGTSNVGNFIIKNTKMSVIICDESMHMRMVDAALESNPDIILHPSAFGEPLPCVDYPLVCSPLNNNKLSNTLFVTINISSTDIHGDRSYGRTSIMKGNAVLFSISSNKTQIILYDTVLDTVNTRQISNAT